jgi:hypothetical protein
LYAFLALIEGLLVMFWIASIPADPKNALVGGLSLNRLGLLGITGLGIAFITTVLVSSIHNPELDRLICGWIEKKAWAHLSGLTGLGIALVLLIPGTDLGKWLAAYERIRPLITWICLLTMQWSVLVLAASVRIASRIKEWVFARIVKFCRIILGSMVVLITSYILSLILYPLGNKENFWWETGVPILGWQLILSTTIGMIYYQFEKKRKVNWGKKIDIILFLLIFISWGLLWSSSRLNSSYFNPGPFPPNNLFYPNSDAAKFDMQAQSSLVGLGLNSGLPLDRPFYPMFLAIIHLISGQNYANNMMLQAFLFGVFPALVYLICMELGSRSWGVMTSTAIGLLGNNTIQSSNLLTSSNPKQMLTEFPMAIMLSVLLYFTIRWLKSGEHSGIFACITGALLAAAAYVRYAALPLLPIWLIVAVIKYRPAYKKGLIEAALMIVSFLAFTAPWYTRNIAAGKGLAVPFSDKILFVIHERYQTPEITPFKKVSTPVGEGTDSVQPIATATGNSQIDIVPSENSNTSQPSGNFFYWFPSHLVHNLMSSILILPTSLEMASLKTSLDIGGEIWQPGWNGILSSPRSIILLLQFIVLSAGFAVLFRKDKTIAAIVILLFCGVIVANALGRSSGGRYSVPVDWLVLVIYSAGFLHLIGKLDFYETMGDGHKAGKTIGWRQLVITIVSLVFIGAFPFIYERISTNLIHRAAKIQAVEELAGLPGSDISNQEIYDMGQFLDKQHAISLQGAALYPVMQQIKDMGGFPTTVTDNFQGTILSFDLLQTEYYISAFFPINEAIDIQNQDEIYLTGCKINKLILVRDLVIIRADRARLIQSNSSFNSCKQFESSN